MLNRFVIIFTSILLGFSLFSCNDGPTSLGTNLLPNQDFINAHLINSVDSSFNISSKFYDTDTLSLSNSSRMLLGKTGNVESTMLMKFYMFFPDSIKKAINDNSLILKSAVVEMKPIYTYGDINNSFKYSVHKINNEWNSLKFGRDDLTTLDYDDDDVSSNQKENVGNDSLMTFDIDNTLVNSWLKYSANDEQDKNQGIYYKFDNSLTDKIIGFTAISSRYDSIQTKLKMFVEIGQRADTIAVEVTSDVHVVNAIKSEMPTQTAQNIYVQGGIPIRSNLKFDVSTIPKHAIINKATVKLFIDDNNTQFGTDSSKFLGALLLTDFDNSVLSTRFAGTILSFDSLAYSGEVTQFVQEWVSNENNGMKLHLFDEIETVNKVAIHGAEADISVRPYLEIIYTSKN